jgi:hypothetical protein
MAESAFAFYRGAAAVMAADLAGSPITGLTAQICGDAHLANFGTYASPERRQVFDLNDFDDFDETLPGPWEWDVKRLAASVVLAARDNGWDDDVARTAAVRSVAAIPHRDGWARPEPGAGRLVRPGVARGHPPGPAFEEGPAPARAARTAGQGADEPAGPRPAHGGGGRRAADPP